MEEKEAVIAHDPNGRMRVRRPRKSKTEKEKLEQALKRVKEKLGVEETNALKAKYIYIYIYIYIKVRDGICGPHKSIGPRTTFGPHLWSGPSRSSSFVIDCPRIPHFLYFPETSKRNPHPGQL